MGKDKQQYVIGFYNLENLFDTKNNPNTLDDDFTPMGVKNWNKERYKNKIHKLGKTISRIGVKDEDDGPVLVGVAEVENEDVMEDLVESKYLNRLGYDFVHFDSPDERGIDTGLLFRKKYFEVEAAEVIPLYLYEEGGKRDYTRDILYVQGELNGEFVHVFVNHWPSRRNGEDTTVAKRVAAAKVLRERLELICEQEEDPAFIIMGDFNADPISESIKELMFSALYNPMEKLLSPIRGSAKYRADWSLFDQIIVSHNFFDLKKGTHRFSHAEIFDEKFLQNWKGRYRGAPFRTFVGRTYKGGYSDHFPVYIKLNLYK
jgi:exonuclease III